MTYVRKAVPLALAAVMLASPASAEDGEPATLTAVPPASLSPEIAPVRDLITPAWGVILRTSDLEGTLQRDRADSSERFTLKGDVFFEVDKATLTAKAREELDSIAAELTGVEIDELQVDGHTDTVGSDAHNAELSEDRADSVADYLREELAGVEIDTAGHGSTRLLMAEEGSAEEIAEARSRNRRVEITVSYGE